jgi:hypothetical protein
MGTALAVIAGIGTLFEGISQANAAESNAKAAKSQAKSIRQASAFNARTRERQFASAEASNMARISASGLSLSGSPLEVLGENAYNFERDQVIEAYNANVQATAYENQARNLRSQKGSILASSIIGGVGQGFLMSQLFGGLKLPALGKKGISTNIASGSGASGLGWA